MKHKLLKSLLLLSALVVGSGNVWADTGTLVSALNGISSGDTYYIAALNSNKYYTVPNTTIDGQTFTCTEGSLSGTTLTPATGAGEFVFTAKSGVNNAFYIYNTNLKKYLVATGSKKFGYVDNTSDDYGYWTFSTVGSGDFAGFSGVFSVQHSNKTHYMRAYSNTVKCYDGTSNNGVYLFKKDPSNKVTTPSINGDTPFITSTEVSISCATTGATIQYSLDNGTSWTNYSDPFTLTETTTVKAKASKSEMTNSDEASATFTKVTPLTVADALTAINALADNGTLNDQYVAGIVSQVDSYSSQYHSITYWISDDGKTTSQLEVYGGKGLNGANFSASTDLEVGDQVVVCGTLKKYVKNSNTTPEFDSGNYLLSLTEIQESDLTKTGDINLSMAAPTTTATASNFFTTSSTGAITYSGGNQAVATINTTTGVVTPVAAGSTTITVTQAADVNYKGKSITINVIVAAASLNPTTIYFDPVSATTPYGTPKVVDYLIDDTYDGTVAAVSDCEAVATVVITQPTSGAGTFTITPRAVGTAIITVSAPATAICEAADDVEYTIYVVGPESLTTAAPMPAIVFNEGFSKCESSGGNDGNFATSNNTEITTENDYTNNEGWDFTKGYPAKGCVKFGGGSSKGSATTPAITVANGKTYSLIFKAAPWSEEASKTMTVKVTGGTINGKTSATTSAMTAGQWNDFIFDIVATSTSMTLEFSCSANRFFLDEVFVASGLITAKLNSYGFGTFCSEYPIDFSKTNAEDQGFTAWNITAVDENSGVITFAQIDEPVAGGAGVFLKGEPNATVFLTSADSYTIPTGLLRGTLAPTYIAQGQPAYGLKGNKFVPIAAESVLPANKAALVLGGMIIINPVKEFTFDFGETPDGIVSPLGETEEGAGAIYNLAGQRIQKMQKGINIVNGKKILK